MKIVDKLVNWYFSRNALPYWCILLADCLLCFLSGLITCWLFFRGSQTLANLIPITRTLLLYMVFNIVSFRVFHTYTGILRYSSFVDLRRVAYAMGLAMIMVWLLHYPIIFWEDQHIFIPLHTRHIVCMYAIGVVALWTERVLVKAVYDVSFGSSHGRRTLIYGVQDGGIALAKNMHNDKSGNFQLKGFITRDPHYRSMILLGEKVYIVDENLKDLFKDMNIQAVLVSPLQNNNFREDTELQDMLIEAGVHIYMMPQPKEWDSVQELSTSQLHEVSVEDLLPRDQIEVDMDAIARTLQGKRILITGSAGSIGSEMVRQIANCKPADMILVDQAETPQHNIRLYMRKEHPEQKCETIVASILQQDRMEEIFRDLRPDYVFHAAAYKHVPMMEDNPSEAIINNVYGTRIIADLSVKYGVEKFVMISTDKAVNPTNVMGCSKRLCEIYTQSLNSAQPTTEFVTTRFGNVLGSNGSVIPIFEKQIRNGGPVTVTDPHVTRFFMLIPEACELVLEAGTHGHGGQIFVFDMGQSVRIADLAERMIKLSGAKNVHIVYTGLRPGEKLYEEVLADQESTEPTFNKKIRIAKVRQYEFKDVSDAIDQLIATANTYDSKAVIAQMKALVPEYKPANTTW